MTSTVTRTRRSRNAVHATITVTPCEGPEGRWLVAVCYSGTDRLIPDLCWSQPDYDTAAALGNALVDLFNTINVATALDALPKIRNILNLAA
jgi:hypothetical protein